MGRNTWNANAFHRKHSRHRFGGGRPRLQPVIALGMLGVLLAATGAAAVASQADKSSLPDDQVGICHATGSEAQPFVYIAVDRNGAEHGHHEQHPDDKVDVASAEECGPAPASTVAPMSAGSEAGNDTADATAECTHENHTQHSHQPTECDGDAGVRKTGGIVGDRIVFNLTVESFGPGEANRVRLQDRLPDVGRAWRISGPAAADCRLEENRTLRCEFGDLAVGQRRDLSASALHCPQDCGEDVQNSAQVKAVNDWNASNDRASVRVEIPDCPEDEGWDDFDGDEPATSSPSPSPNTGGNSSGGNASGGNSSTGNPSAGNSTPPPASPAANSSTPPSNSSTPAPNPTQNGSTSPAPAPAPQRADAQVGQRVIQDAEQVTLQLSVRSLGPGTVENVSLADTLPNVRRAWFLGGADAESCTLDGSYLSCAFGDLAFNETRSVELRAYTDRVPCGEHLNNTAVISADNDARASNNRSSAGIAARAC